MTLGTPADAHARLARLIDSDLQGQGKPPLADLADGPLMRDQALQDTDHLMARFQEVGPFVYEQWRRRTIVDILDNNRKIIYKEYKTFYSMWPKPSYQVISNNTSAD